jgi:hypothetical protein
MSQRKPAWRKPIVRVEVHANRITIEDELDGLAAYYVRQYNYKRRYANSRVEYWIKWITAPSAARRARLTNALINHTQSLRLPASDLYATTTPKRRTTKTKAQRSAEARTITMWHFIESQKRGSD